MKVRLLFILLFVMKGLAAYSQEEVVDSVKTLGTVNVRVYEQNRRLMDVAAPVGITTAAQLHRFPATSILPAVNIIPGIRMEERSPGSYRLNIRGSSLRSPFGVRDVKVYLNEIPLTDPSGNTYLNQLSYFQFQSIEFIKGPAASLYGAGIGGAMLIRTQPPNWQPGLSADFMAGSYGTKSLHGSVRLGTTENRHIIDYTHQEADGFRQQTGMRKDVISWESQVRINERQTLHGFFSYSDFYYQTPGGLTSAQFTADPQQARPSTPIQPGATQNQAAVFQKVFLAGLSDQFRFGKAWQNTTAVYGTYTDFINPGIRVYEIRKEPHLGMRSVFAYRKKLPRAQIDLHTGLEIQTGFFNTRDFGNRAGVADSIQLDNNIHLWQYMVFAQADMRLAAGWTITAGASFNRSAVEFTNLLARPSREQERLFNNKVPPHLAIGKKLGDDLTVYASVARGFSTPTVAELLRSDGQFGQDLQPQDGMDYELGLRGQFGRGRGYFDINLFFLHLDNTIVQRIDSFGVFYFVNAGSTRQNGLEGYVSYDFVTLPGHFLGQCRWWLSLASNDFHYRQFKQVANDYSGKKLPGVPASTISSGLDIDSRPGLYLRFTCNYTGSIQLNDANTEQSRICQLYGLRLGWRRETKKRFRIDLYAGGDNLSDARYSLGYDINAAGGRFYNTAPGRSYYAGLSFRWLRPVKAD